MFLFFFIIGIIFHCFAYVFVRVLSMYDIRDEDVNNLTDMSQQLSPSFNSTLEVQLPVLELLKVCHLFILYLMYFKVLMKLIIDLNS